jgi:hypothetical protein
MALARMALDATAHAQRCPTDFLVAQPSGQLDAQVAEFFAKNRRPISEEVTDDGRRHGCFIHQCQLPEDDSECFVERLGNLGDRLERWVAVGVFELDDLLLAHPDPRCKLGLGPPLHQAHAPELNRES